MQKERKMQLHMKHNVPNDIIVEILLRLTAKSLSRLRWACKYWFNLITRDGDFIKMHLHGSTTNHHENLNIILDIIHKSGDKIGYQIFQCSFEYNDTTRVGNISSEVCMDPPLDYPLPHRPRILGSCNGLILLYQSPSLYVWNPCTKEYRLLPHPHSLEFKVSNPLYSGEDNYRFGYDRTTDDYKVIKMKYYCPMNVYELFFHVQVYTLGTNKWRSIRPNTSIKPNPSTLLCGGVFVNGALYWIDYDGNTISFDIGKEKFQHVSKIPNFITNYGWYTYNLRLQEFEGSLCIVLQIQEQQKFYWDIWVMKDYAPNNSSSSWFKLSSIECQRKCEYPLKPLRFTRNGEILMVRNKEDLVLHDPKNNKDKILCKKKCEQPSYFEKVYYTYTESLVSLYSGTYTSQEQKKEQEK